MSNLIKEKGPETIEWKKQFSPILEIPKEGNPIGYGVKYISFSQYNPEVSKDKLPIENAELRRVLEKPYSQDVLNLRNTNHEKVKGFVLDYIRKNPKLTSGIDIYNLTPNQALLLTGKIVAERLIYDYESISIKPAAESNGDKRKTEIMVPRQNGVEEYWERDKGGENFSAPQIKRIATRLQKTQDLPVDELLAKERYAVCRHYSRTFTAIFDALKSLQKGPQLQNTYSINVGNLGHAFNLIATIESGKKINMTVLDPTSADVEKQSSYDTRKGIRTKLGFNIGMFDATEWLGRDANSSLYQQMASANWDLRKMYNTKTWMRQEDYTNQLKEIAKIGKVYVSKKTTTLGGILNQSIGGGREVITKSEEIRNIVFGL